jgi:hypothetical protein
VSSGAQVVGYDWRQKREVISITKWRFRQKLMKIADTWLTPANIACAPA